MPRITPWIFVLLVSLVGVPRHALAQGPAKPQRADSPVPPVGETLEAAGRIPADVDLVLVVQNAVEIRKTPLASAAAGLFAVDGPMSDSRSAWRALAAELGWTEEEALDRLLGRQVVLAARGIADPETAHWVLLSQVSLATDRRLKERLKAAPRGIAHGQQVLAIEGGRYELTSWRQPAKAAPGTDDERAVTVLLAPAGRSQLLDTMLEQLARGKPAGMPLRAEPVFAEAATLGSSEILLLARLGGRVAVPAPGDPAWPDFLVISASRSDKQGEQTCWTGRVALRERARQQSLLAAGISSDAVFNALSPTSLLMVVQMAPLATIFGRTLPFDDPLTQLPWPPRAAELFTGKQAIRVHAAPGTDPDAKPGLACTLAMEATDGPKLAATLDPSIGMFFAEVERAAGQRNDSTPPLPDFAGFAPQALRILSIEIGSAGPLAGVTGPGLNVSWSFASTGGGATSWWALATSGSGANAALAPAAVRDVAAAVSMAGKGGPSGRDSRWIWLMSARPRELESLVAPGVPDYLGIRTLMRKISDAGCRLSITENGDIRGELTVRLEPADGR